MKSNESTLLDETLARESVTGNELLTLQYGLKLGNVLITKQYALNLFLIAPKIHIRLVAAILVGHLAAPAIKHGLGGLMRFCHLI